MIFDDVCPHDRRRGAIYWYRYLVVYITPAACNGLYRYRYEYVRYCVPGTVYRPGSRSGIASVVTIAGQPSARAEPADGPPAASSGRRSIASSIIAILDTRYRYLIVPYTYGTISCTARNAVWRDRGVRRGVTRFCALCLLSSCFHSCKYHMNSTHVLISSLPLSLSCTIDIR